MNKTTKMVGATALAGVIGVTGLAGSVSADSETETEDFEYEFGEWMEYSTPDDGYSITDETDEDAYQFKDNNCSVASMAFAFDQLSQFDWEYNQDRMMDYANDNFGTHVLTAPQQIEMVENFSASTYTHKKPSDFNTGEELAHELAEQIDEKDWAVPFLIKQTEIDSNSNESTSNHYMNVVKVTEDEITFHDGAYYEGAGEYHTVSVEEFYNAVEKMESEEGHGSAGIITRD
ncbi:MAG: hypothetical protein ACOC56_01975 [Atribacterota bacterium]